MNDWDRDRDGFLSQADFLDFYTDAAKGREDVVWRNLHSYYYRNDLVLETEVPKDEIDERLMPRYMLMKGFNSQIYDMLFTLMTTIKTEEFN